MSDLEKPAPALPSTKPPAPRTESICRIDFSTTCPQCQIAMVPVHSHYQCTRCGWRDSCCF